MLQDVRIRNAVETDKDFIVSNIGRIAEYGASAWRDRETMVATDTAVIVKTLLTRPPNSVILIAEDRNAVPLGFIHVTTEMDYYSQHEQAHIGDLVVASGGEGQGIGAALMRAGEAWARERGFALLTLNVFTQNERARQLYERVGFQPDTVRYIKPL